MEFQEILLKGSFFGKNLESDHIKYCKQYFGTDNLIIKPITGASAYKVVHIHKNSKNLDNALEMYSNSAFLIQPFISSITTEGEISCILFNSKIHHVIKKLPSKGDFRVQKEYGGTLSYIDTPNNIPDKISRIIGVLKEAPLYARVDLVLLDNNNYAVMELEIIEPSLHLDMHEAAPGAFAQAIQDRYMYQKQRENNIWHFF